MLALMEGKLTMIARYEMLSVLIMMPMIATVANKKRRFKLVMRKAAYGPFTS
jgi:hypothetical protein